MKDSLWEVDRAQGVGFRDPRDEQAETQFDLDEPQVEPLSRLLLQKLQSSEQTRVHSLWNFALFETVYRPEHVIKALKPLVDRGTVKVEGRGAIRIASIISVTG